MKRILLVMVMIVAGGVSSCKKIKDAVFPVIDIDLPAFQFSIPAIPIVLSNEASLGSFTMHFNLDSLVKDKTGNVFGADDVSTVKVKTIAINILDADAANNLANFESTRFTFSSNTRSEPVQIVAATFPDTYAASATLTPTDSPELRDYLLGTELTYTLYGKMRRTTSKPLTFNVLVTISAK